MLLILLRFSRRACATWQFAVRPETHSPHFKEGVTAGDLVRRVADVVPRNHTVRLVDPKKTVLLMLVAVRNVAASACVRAVLRHERKNLTNAHRSVCAGCGADQRGGRLAPAAQVQRGGDAQGRGGVSSDRAMEAPLRRRAAMQRRIAR